MTSFYHLSIFSSEKKLEITKRRGGTNCTNRSFHELGGDYLCPPMIRGIDRIREPRLHQGLGYSLIERQVFGIHGLLPPRIKTQEEQIELGKYCIAKASTDLDKYLFLADLQVTFNVLLSFYSQILIHTFYKIYVACSSAV